MQNQKRQKIPTAKDIALFNKTLTYLTKNGTCYKCPECSAFITVPKSINSMSSDDLVNVFGKLSRQSLYNRWKRWIEFGWVSKVDLHASTIKIKRHYKQPTKMALKKLNKSIKRK